MEHLHGQTNIVCFHKIGDCLFLGPLYSYSMNFEERGPRNDQSATNYSVGDLTCGFFGFFKAALIMSVRVCVRERERDLWFKDLLRLGYNFYGDWCLILY